MLYTIYVYLYIYIYIYIIINIKILNHNYYIRIWIILTGNKPERRIILHLWDFCLIMAAIRLFLCSKECH